MANQFLVDEQEDEQSEPELDVQKAHLVTHAKVYAIAEKYVCPSSLFISYNLPDYAPLHVGLLSFAPAGFSCTYVVLRCVARRFHSDIPRDLRHRRPITLPGARSTIRSSSPSRLSFLSVSALHVHAQSASWPSICPLETDRVSVQLPFGQSCDHAASRNMQSSSLTYQSQIWHCRPESTRTAEVCP